MDDPDGVGRPEDGVGVGNAEPVGGFCAGVAGVAEVGGAGPASSMAVI